MASVLANQPPVSAMDLPDGELLRRYLATKDSPALEAMVRRHGGMVLGVCRRVLGDVHEAEDAFQATFLVFVRKAGAVRSGAQVAPWLYGVATRTALKARSLAARRRAREKLVNVLPDVAAPAGPATADWQPLLDREVAGLPAKYRLPVLLCELQGLNRTDAARQLGIREGTLSSRLARARVLLRKRLSRRGVGAAVLVAAVLFPTAAPAAPPTLVATTVRAATAFAAGTALTTPPALIALAVLAGLRRTRLAVGALVVLCLALIIGGVFLFPRPGQPVAVVDTRSDREKLQGTWAAVSTTMNGVAGDPNGTQPLHVEGDRANLPFDSDYILDPAANPKRIDLTCRILPPPTNFMQGIYEIDGDDLKVCTGQPGVRDRPTAFNAAPGTGWKLVVYKRQLPAR